MGLINVVRINKTIYSWGSMIFRIDGHAKLGLVSVDWEQERRRRVVPSNIPGAPPLGVTGGRYEAKSLSMKMLTDEWDILTDYLTLKAAGSYGAATFSFLIQASESGLAPLSLLGTNCNITGEKEAYEEGIEENLTELEMTCTYLTRNGKALWSNAVAGLG